MPFITNGDSLSRILNVDTFPVFASIVIHLSISSPVTNLRFEETPDEFSLIHFFKQCYSVSVNSEIYGNICFSYLNVFMWLPSMSLAVKVVRLVPTSMFSVTTTCFTGGINTGGSLTSST